MVASPMRWASSRRLRLTLCWRRAARLPRGCGKQVRPSKTWRPAGANGAVACDCLNARYVNNPLLELVRPALTPHLVSAEFGHTTPSDGRYPKKKLCPLLAICARKIGQSATPAWCGASTSRHVARQCLPNRIVGSWLINLDVLEFGARLLELASLEHPTQRVWEIVLAVEGWKVALGTGLQTRGISFGHQSIVNIRDDRQPKAALIHKVVQARHVAYPKQVVGRCRLDDSCPVDVAVHCHVCRAVAGVAADELVKHVRQLPYDVEALAAARAV